MLRECSADSHLASLKSDGHTLVQQLIVHNRIALSKGPALRVLRWKALAAVFEVGGSCKQGRVTVA